VERDRIQQIRREIPPLLEGIERAQSLLSVFRHGLMNPCFKLHGELSLGARPELQLPVIQEDGAWLTKERRLEPIAARVPSPRDREQDCSAITKDADIADVHAGAQQY